MEYQIVEKPAFSVVGKGIRVSTKDGDNFKVIPEFWGHTVEVDGTLERLIGLSKEGEAFPNSVLGLCLDFAPDMSEFTYMVAAEGSEKDATDGFNSVAVPAATWAIFQGQGSMPEAIQNLWQKIFSEFFAAGEYKHGIGPEIEIYPPGDTSSPDYEFEVLIPVVKI